MKIEKLKNDKRTKKKNPTLPALKPVSSDLENFHKFSLSACSSHWKVTKFWFLVGNSVVLHLLYSIVLFYSGWMAIDYCCLEQVDLLQGLAL